MMTEVDCFEDGLTEKPVEIVKKTMQENIFLHWTSLNQFCASPPLHLQITFPKIVSLKFAIETPARRARRETHAFCFRSVCHINPTFYPITILSWVLGTQNPIYHYDPLWSPLFNGHFWAHMYPYVRFFPWPQLLQTISNSFLNHRCPFPIGWLINRGVWNYLFNNR